MERPDDALSAEVEVVAGGVSLWLILFGDGSAASEFEYLLLSVSLWLIVFLVGVSVFVLLSNEDRLIHRGLSHGRPPVLFPNGLPGLLVGLDCLLLCSCIAVCSFLGNFFLSALFVHPLGTYYVEAPSGLRCLKTEDKFHICLRICMLRSRLTVMVGTVTRLKD